MAQTKGTLKIKGNITTILLIAAIAFIAFLYIKESSHTSTYKKENTELQKQNDQIKDSLESVRFERKNLQQKVDSAYKKAYIADSLLQKSNSQVSELVKRYRDGIKIPVIHNDSIDSELERIYSKYGLEATN